MNKLLSFNPGLNKELPENWKQIATSQDGTAYQNENGLYVIVSGIMKEDEKAWISILISRKSRMPEWREIKTVKNIFIGKDKEATIQLLSDDKERENPFENCISMYYCLGGKKNEILETKTYEKLIAKMILVYEGKEYPCETIIENVSVEHARFLFEEDVFDCDYERSCLIIENYGDVIPILGDTEADDPVDYKDVIEMRDLTIAPILYGGEKLKELKEKIKCHIPSKEQEASYQKYLLKKSKK